MNNQPFQFAVRTLCVGLSLAWFGGAFGLSSLSAQPVPIGSGTVPDYFDGGKVARIVATLLEEVHISNKPFDQTINKIFLTGFYNAMDPTHMVFMQSDIDEFNAKYLETINNLTKSGDITPATEINRRYVERLQQWEPFIQELLKQKMDFATEESFLTDRRKVPWPKDETEAKELWRKRIKFEILGSRLAVYDAKKRSEIAARMSTLVQSPDGKKMSIMQQNDLERYIKDNSDKQGEGRATSSNRIMSIPEISKEYSRLLKHAKEQEPVDLIERYLTSLTYSFDPHSEYQAPEEAKNFEIMTINLSLTGIGAVLRSEDGYAEIVSLVPGGPAALNKELKPNDRVIAVKQDHGEPVDVVDMRLNKVVDLIRGPRGTKVTLTVVPADISNSGIHKDITIVRDEVRLQDQRAKGRIFERTLPEGGVERLGLLTLDGFYDNVQGHYSATEDTAKLIKRMEQEKVSGVIVDLRRNGGGLLEQARQLTSLFIKEGPVVQVKDSKGGIEPLSTTGDHQIYTGPLMVLTSKLSASASEIVAAALQDYGRAILVGDKTTHGKGTVQKVVDLKSIMDRDTAMDWDPGQLKITTQMFYRIGGNTTQFRGVTPNVVLPSVRDYLEDLGEASLPNALPADQIPSAPFVKIGAVDSVVPYLAARSSERIKQDKDFGYVMDEIELQKKRNADKSVSLDEAKRRAEIDQIEGQSEFIMKERALRKPTADKVYSISVEMVDSKQPLKQISGPGTLERPKNADSNGEDESIEGEEEQLSDKDVELPEALNILRDYIAPHKTPEGLANGASKPPA